MENKWISNRGSYLKKSVLFTLLIAVIAFSTAYIYIKNKNIDISSIFCSAEEFSALEAENVTEFSPGVSEVLAVDVCNSGILLCTKEGVYLYNKKGEMLWKYSGIYNSPIMKTSGNIIMVTDKGTKNITVLEAGKVKWEYALQGEVINAGINEQGYIWAVHEQVGHRGAVTVISPAGLWLFTRKCAEDFVVSASICRDGSELLINSIDTSKTKGSTNITFLNIKGEVFASISREDEIFPCAAYTDNNSVIAVGDKNILCIDEAKKVKWEESLGDTKVYTSCFPNIGRAILVTSDKSRAGFFEGANSFVKLKDKKGKTAWQRAISGQAKTVDCNGSLISVNTGREVFIINAKGKEKGKFCPGRDIKDAKVIDNNSVAVFMRDSVAVVSAK